MWGDEEADRAANRSAAILVIDDNPIKRLAINAILGRLGYPVVEAESGEAGLRAVMQRRFAVILVDVHMPGMDGYETVRMIRLRHDSEHTPIIFITANARDEVEHSNAYATGGVDFIFGAIDAATLRAKVSVFVALFLKSRELSDSEARTRAVLENVADGIITIDQDGLIESFNRAATRLFGYTEAEAIGMTFTSLVRPDNAPKVRHEQTQRYLLSQQRSGRSTVSTGLRKDGASFPLELALSDVQLGERTIHIGCLRDISERQTYTDTLEHQALHDNLTGLPNRALFRDRVEHAIRAATRDGKALALLVLDLDGFKHINDTLGHQHGDVLLKLLADRIVGCLRDGDTVARLGGDEFGILPLVGTDLAGAAAVAWTIQQAVTTPFVIDGESHDVHASIGIALFPEHGDNLDDLLRRADLAMYEAKSEHAPGGYALFTAEQEEEPARRLAILGDLRTCIERDELVLHYQPKIDLATGKAIGAEALIRWNHPSGRLFSPGEFMLDVENTDLMLPITQWVLNEALHQQRVWRDAGYDLSMAVNVGARCLASGNELFSTVDEIIERWDLVPEKVTLEFTEVALIDTAIPGLMAHLEAMDVRLSIDDFGTGYSSLVYLQRLPVAEIKADRSFVTSMAAVADDAVIVRSTIDLAHNLGTRVVAEGVEDETTMDLLIDYGCDEAQGYHFSRPLPAAELTEWLATSRFAPARRPAASDSVTLAA